jgi:cation transport ATPase
MQRFKAWFLTMLVAAAAWNVSAQTTNTASAKSAKPASAAEAAASARSDAEAEFEEIKKRARARFKEDVAEMERQGADRFAKLREMRGSMVSHVDTEKENLRQLQQKQNDVLLYSDPRCLVLAHDESFAQDEAALSGEASEAVVRYKRVQQNRREEEKARCASDVQKRKEVNDHVRLATRRTVFYENLLSMVDDMISQSLARDLVEQGFKATISFYFAMVVGFMILCFFGISFYDKNIRSTIFSGQAGMQFVTLFSLIIAMILFGITGILGDKELASLLGGLSGYILGKYSPETTKPEPAPQADRGPISPSASTTTPNV